MVWKISFHIPPKSFFAVRKKLDSIKTPNIMLDTYRGKIKNLDAPWNTSCSKQLIITIKFYTAANTMGFEILTVLTFKRS